ncbi:MAG: formyltransferase family protein [Candidatus Moranbacteria bacterium]|nr:formyltransferase family protein [Candidatus Moranbacteria bacterium]
MLNIGIFSSLRDKEAYDLLYGILGAINSGYLPDVSISYVFCDRPEMIDGSLEEGLEEYHTKLFSSSSHGLRKFIFQNKGNELALKQAREEFDRSVDEVIGSIEVDFVLLAGYMLIASPFLCGKLKMLNLHPDLPGRFVGTWQEVMQQIIEQGADTAGAMINLATPELDKGPALAYFSFPVFDPDPEKIRAEEFRRELPLILLTLKALAEGEIQFCEGMVWAGNKKGVRDFSREVENFTF